MNHDLAYPFSELMNILIISFSHSLIPKVRLAFDLLSFRSKVSIGYRFVGLVEYHFDNIIVGYALNS